MARNKITGNEKTYVLPFIEKARKKKLTFVEKEMGTKWFTDGLRYWDNGYPHECTIIAQKNAVLIKDAEARYQGLI